MHHPSEVILVSHPRPTGRPVAARCDRERGATAAEYAVMVGLIATVVAAGVGVFGLAVQQLFTVPPGL